MLCGVSLRNYSYNLTKVALFVSISFLSMRAGAFDSQDMPGDLDYTAVMTNTVFSNPDVERNIVYCHDMDGDGVDEIIVGTEIGTVYVIDPVDGSTIMNVTLPYRGIERFVAGNVDDDPEDVIDITDLVYLVDHMFNLGPAPPCRYEANVDGDSLNMVNIADLVYLVDYMFTGGPPPVACP